MKLLTVFLALAILAGSQASVVREKRGTKLDTLKQNVEEYVGNISRTVLDQLDVVRRWDIYREFREKSFESFLNFSQRLRPLEDKLPVEVLETLDRVSRVSTVLGSSVWEAMEEQARKMKPATEQLVEAVLVRVTPYTDPAVEKLRTYTDALRASLPEMRKTHSEKLKHYMEDLEAQVAPRVKSVQSWWQGLQETLQPLVDDVSQLIRKDVNRATNVLKPYVNPLLEKAREYTADFRKRVDSATAPQTQ